VTPADPRRCGEVIAWSATTPTPAGSTSSGSSPSCAAGSTACRPRTTPTVPPHGNHAFPSTPPFLDALFTRQATDHLYQTSPASPWTVALAAISPQPGPRPLPVQQLRLPRLPHSLRRPHRRQRQQSWPSRHRRRHHVARRPCWPSIRPPSRERATGRHGGEYPRWAPPTACWLPIRPGPDDARPAARPQDVDSRRRHPRDSQRAAPRLRDPWHARPLRPGL
jgi:hypothetical protein